MEQPKVKIQLKGEYNDIVALKSCYTPPYCEIILENHTAFLISDELDASTSIEEINMKAEDFLDRMNGVARVLHPEFLNVSIAQILTLKDGNYNLNILLPLIQGRNVFFEHTLTASSKPSKPYSQILVEASYNDEMVREVLHYFNKENWINLYKIYELIRHTVGTSKLEEWSSGNTVTRFRLTAQSKKLLGDEARHADPKVPQPGKPMSLEEASKLIRKFLRKYLEFKMSLDPEHTDS